MNTWDQGTIEYNTRVYGQPRIVEDRAGSLWFCWADHTVTLCNGIHCAPKRVLAFSGSGLVWSEAGPFVRPQGA